jgi:hypothetical protein
MTGPIRFRIVDRSEPAIRARDASVQAQQVAADTSEPARQARDTSEGQQFVAFFTGER